jgi:hypothetical protein
MPSDRWDERSLGPDHHIDIIGLLYRLQRQQPQVVEILLICLETAFP